MADLTRVTVQQLYDAYRQGNRDLVSDLIDDDVDWVLYGPMEVFPFSGHRRGKSAALASLNDIAKDYALERYDLEIVVVEEDRAAVMSDVAFRQRATDRLLRFRIADFLRFRNGRLIQFREFCDSFDVVEQALGRHLQVDALPGTGH